MEGGCGWGRRAWGIALSSPITGPQKLKHFKQFDVSNVHEITLCLFGADSLGLL